MGCKMSISLDQFGLAFKRPLAAPTSRSYRPPSWPPPRDWCCIEDRDGNEVSRWGDPEWKLWPWTGKKQTISFGDGPQRTAKSIVLDQANADILRCLVTWRIWGPRGITSANTVMGFADLMKKIASICSQHKVLASDLSRFPILIKLVAQSIGPSRFATMIAELDRLRDAREFLGFEILDQAGIQLLRAAQPEHTPSQTEYIPPRIWTHLALRLHDCLADYLAHQNQIEECFAFCLDAYKSNRVIDEETGRRIRQRSPFRKLKQRMTGENSSLLFLGPFEQTASRFGLRSMLERWVGNLCTTQGIKGFTAYLSLIQYVGLADVLCFTLMRFDEGMSLRKDSLIWHDDPVYGRIPLIQAETTKTDPDDNALWVTSPSIEPAITALRSVAAMRRSCLSGNVDTDNPYLITHAVEPWGKSNKVQAGVRPEALPFSQVVGLFPRLLDAQCLSITDDDLKIALAVNPTLDRNVFQVGKPWRLAWHQLRRTGAVNMFASGSISDSTMQLQMKHLTRLMSLYYGRGNSALRLNDQARVLLVNAQYEAMGRQLAEVHTDRYISPYGKDHKEKLLMPAYGKEAINLMGEKDAQCYENAARKHQISFRRTVLGACMKNGQCDGDCVSFVGDCAGGDGKSPCASVLFDRNRATANQTRLDGVIKQLKSTPPDTPRHRHLEQERRGLENYFAHISGNQ